MTTSARLTRGTMWALLGLLAVGLFLPVAGAMPPSASWQNPNPNNPPQSWAWGAVYATSTSGTVSGTTANGTAYSLTYSLHAFLGWNTILTQTNTSSTAFTLAEQRAAAASYYLSASGNYGATTGQLNVTAQGWELEQGSANFVTNGTVLLNGTTSVPALAVTSAQGSAAGNLTVTGSASLGGNLHATWNGYASADAYAQATVNFNPALGLIPLNYTPGAWWTSTSQFVASGNYTIGCHYGYAGSSALGNSGGGGNCGSSGSASGSGSVFLTGADHSADIVNGRSYRWVTLGLSGDGWNFDLRDGFILIPARADLFAGASESSASGAPSSGSALGTSHLDYDPSASHLGIVASNTQLTPAAGFGSTTATEVPTAVQPHGGIASVAPVASSSGIQAINVQGAPETPSAAQTSNGCLMSGGCSPATTSKGLTSPMGLLVVGVAAVAVVVAAVAISRARSKPPTAPVGAYSSRPPSAFLLHNPPPSGPSGPGSVPPQTPGSYSPGRPPI